MRYGGFAPLSRGHSQCLGTHAAQRGKQPELGWLLQEGMPWGTLSNPTRQGGVGTTGDMVN